MEETKETKITFYFEENEKSEEEKLRKVSEKIIDEYEEYNDKLLIKKSKKNYFRI